jgi:Na+/proline symporter
VLILLLSFMLIPFAIQKAGGMEAFHEGLPEYMFSLVAPSEITLFFIVMAVINALVMVVVLPHHMAIGGSGRTEIACRIGWTYGNFLKRFATAGWAFIGVFSALLFPEMVGTDREMVFGVAARELLPIGLVGLMLSAMIAAMMSTCDAFMVHASALFTQNLYKGFINPDCTSRQQVQIGRIAGIVVVAGGLVFAYSFDSVVQGIKEGWKITAYMGIAFWAGVMWRRANRWGTIASVISMAIIGNYTHHVLNWPFAWQAASYLPAGLLCMIGFSLATREEPAGKLHAFYTLLQTPVGQEEQLHAQGIEIKLDAAPPKHPPHPLIAGKSDPGDRLLIVDLLHLPKTFSWRHYRTDLLGFAIAALIAALTIAVVVWLAGLGDA